MKNILLCLALLMAATACADDKVISADKLPEAIKTYLSTNFPAAKVVRAEEDRDGFSKYYEVLLNNQIEISFAENGNVREVESKNDGQLPDAVVPAKILAYVKSNYANNFVTQWEKQRNGYDVELNNDIELLFGTDGTFKRVKYDD